MDPHLSTYKTYHCGSMLRTMMGLVKEIEMKLEGSSASAP